MMPAAEGMVLEFPALRAPVPALSLLAFAALCALLPALGLGALVSLDNGSPAMHVSLVLIGGLAAPFLLASAVFAVLALYMLANALRVEAGAGGIVTERRVLGVLTRRRHIARADIAGIEPRIGARFQNLFSSLPRYALIARHRGSRAGDVVVAEDLAGEAAMQAMLARLSRAVGL
jgi:hypothetical protein